MRSISVLELDPIKDRTEVRERFGVPLQESSFPDAIKVAEALALYSSLLPGRRRLARAHGAP